MPDPTADALVAGWITRFDTLRGLVNEIHMTAEVIEALDAELVSRPREGSGFFLDAILRPMYATAQSLRVRRLVDRDNRTESLDRLLAAMVVHPEVLTRERYVEHYRREGDESYMLLGHADFNRIVGSADADHVPSSLLIEMRARAQAAAQTVTDYVNQQVAHRERDAKVSLTWGQLRTAIEEVSSLYTELGVIITGSTHEPKPMITDHWEQIFGPGLFSTDKNVDILLAGLFELRITRPDDYMLELDIGELVEQLGGDIDATFYRERSAFG